MGNLATAGERGTAGAGTAVAIPAEGAAVKPRSLPADHAGLVSLLIALLFFITWEAAVGLGLVSGLFFPAPSQIGGALVQLGASGELLVHLRASMSRHVSGLLLGGVPGLLLGMVMGWSVRTRRILDPFIAAVHPVPKIAIFPLVMVIFGIGETSKVVVVAIAAFFPMLINTMAGVRQINPVLLEVARNYGAGPLRTFTRVVFPGSLPMVLTGLRLALNLALLLTISVEIVSAQRGIGAAMWLSWEIMRVENLYAFLVVAAGLGISFNLVVHVLTRTLIPWQADERGARR
jgi:ABC-type nitrate/sulfonate/bicarbonate transport system permease component